MDRPSYMRILGAGFSGHLERYIQDPLHIKKVAEGGDVALNSKGEWGRVALRCPTVVAE